MDKHRPAKVPDRYWKWGAGLVAAAVLGLAATAALGRPGGHGFGPEFALWKIERMLRHVDASDDQRVQIEEIAEQAIAEMRELRSGKGEIRRAFADILTAETVDRDALEELRVEMSEARDEASKRMTRAIADIAEVLSQEQRLAIAERMAHRGERQEHW